MTLATRLFVGNLPDNFNDNALRDAFSSYGEVTNFDLKCKPGVENDNDKRFAFVTISASNYDVESCIKYFSNEDFNGSRLYVTRARESFLERLQRERAQLQNNNAVQSTKVKNEQEHLPNKTNVDENYNKHKRKLINDKEGNENTYIKKPKVKASHDKEQNKPPLNPENNNDNNFNKNKKPDESKQRLESIFQNDKKKQNSDLKRLESMKRKKQEFNEKKNIIKTGLISIDKQLNKKVIFTDIEDDNTVQENSKFNNSTQENNKTPLFDDGGSDDEINFEVKEQYEGKKGQKVLDLQSKYKSDKRFVLDERFIEDSGSEKDENDIDKDEFDLNQADEKSKQLNILQDVLGVTIKPKPIDTNRTKTKLGMLRFDPSQPEHAKYLLPVPTQEPQKKSKKKKSKESQEEKSEMETEHAVERVEVSKEQFYKISDSLKETMTQPSTFSLRSLFSKENETQNEGLNENINYNSLQIKKDKKVKNPLDPGEKNPFVYDSSESENEEENNTNEKKALPERSEIKTVWREKLFFSTADLRLKDGLNFFCNANKEGHKERRELKSLMKKRIYNKERKNTMFQKKIGGRKKTMRKKFTKK